MFKDKRTWVSVVVAAVIAVVVLVSIRAKAQTVPAPIQVDRQFSVSLTLAQWQKIADMLAEKPFKDVAPLITALQQQISAQDAKQQEEKPK